MILYALDNTFPDGEKLFSFFPIFESGRTLAITVGKPMSPISMTVIGDYETACPSVDFETARQMLAKINSCAPAEIQIITVTENQDVLKKEGAA